MIIRTCFVDRYCCSHSVYRVRSMKKKMYERSTSRRRVFFSPSLFYFFFSSVDVFVCREEKREKESNTPNRKKKKKNVSYHDAIFLFQRSVIDGRFVRLVAAVLRVRFFSSSFLVFFHPQSNNCLTSLVTRTPIFLRTMQQNVAQKKKKRKKKKRRKKRKRSSDVQESSNLIIGQCSSFFFFLSRLPIWKNELRSNACRLFYDEK